MVCLAGRQRGNDGSIGAPWSLAHAVRGAGGLIQPGHTVVLRGGTYDDERGWKVCVSGTAGLPISFRPYVDPATSVREKVVLDGSLPEFRTKDSGAWIPHVELSRGHNVYRSVKAYRAAKYSAFIDIGGDWYSLCSLKNDLRYITSDQHRWDAPSPHYPGPSICQDRASDSPTKDHLFIRLDNSTPEAQLNRDVAQIGEPDPSKHALRVGMSDRFGLDVRGSHLVFEDIEIDNFFGCFNCQGGPTQRDVIFRRCGGRTHFWGMRAGAMQELTLESCEWRGHMPPERWWVSVADIKGGELPADNSRKAGVGLDKTSHVVIVNCLVDEFFDGILADGAHDVEVHGCQISAWDDAWQMYASLYRVNYHHNVHFGAGPSHDGSGSHRPNIEPGTVFVHHNLIDTTRGVLFWGRAGHPKAGTQEPIAFSSHKAPTQNAAPWKLYYNTIVTGRLPGSGRYVGWSLFGAEAKQYEARHEVFNNIFLVLDARPGGRDFYVHSGREVYDGNVYWWYGPTAPSELKTPWRYVHWSTGKSQAIQTTEQLRASPAFAESQVYYPPGWESCGLTLDPQLDDQYRPRNALCQAGALDLRGRCGPAPRTTSPGEEPSAPGTPGVVAPQEHGAHARQ